jgi:hypothetical protein
MQMSVVLHCHSEDNTIYSLPPPLLPVLQTTRAPVGHTQRAARRIKKTQWYIWQGVAVAAGSLVGSLVKLRLL